MAFKLNHVHLKTSDPKQTAQFYVDTLGAKMVAEIGTRGYRLDLHGLTLNVTTLIADQARQQVYGMEHFAIETDDLPGVVAKLTANGARILEEHATGDGRKICFLEGPDGVQLELLEMPR
jgi:catechol 2,3-dioxygenase-like lactoylglutathione lyase family enzyme